MAGFAPLEEVLAAHPRCARTQAMLFTQLRYLPTGEGIRIGFRCFAAPAEALLAAFQRGDIAALAALPPALDDAGRPAVSLVRLDIAHVPSGALLGLQPIAYPDWVVTPAAPPLLLEGEEAAAWATTLRELDQHTR